MWILPSRARPNVLQRFFHHYRLTRASTPGVVVIDDDDPCLRDYFEVDFPPDWELLVGKPIGLSPTFNRTFEAFPNEPWYGLIGDDCIPVTPQWDVKLIEAAGQNCISYCADGLVDETQVGHCVLGGELVRELGWLMLPGLIRLYGDNVITDIGQRRGILRYLPDVMIEHLHFSTGKAPMDATYEKPSAAADRRIYAAWKMQFDGVVPVTFVCLKAGTAYGSEYVNILQDMVARNLPEGYPGRFVCLTDDPSGISPSVEILPLPADLEKWWGKLYMFKRELFPDGTRMIFFDLDTLIVGALDKFISYSGRFATLTDFYFPEQVGPAVIAWEAGSFAASIWEEWVAEGKPRHQMGDLWWINNLDQGRFVKSIDKLQDLYPGRFVSYKAHCTPYPPKGTSVVCFHGQPKADNCGQPWVEAVWKLDGASMTELDAVANTNEKLTTANIQSTLARNLPFFVPVVKTGFNSIIIVAGGPSLLDTMPEIVSLWEQGHSVMALNGAAKVLNEAGITPDYQVIIDARESNKGFVSTARVKTYLLASQCAPSLFDEALATDKPVTVFHLGTLGIEKLLPEDQQGFLVSGGTTVGLTALVLANWLGFCNLHLHGYDSSFSTAHHAYPQPSNDADPVLDVTVNEQVFKTTPWMLKQAQQFQELVPQLLDDGITLTVAGYGLLPYIAHCMIAQER